MRADARRSSSILVFVLALVGVPTVGQSLHAQQLGFIRGRVTVEGANRPLGAAQVSVVGTQIGAQTNDNGEYRLNNVPPGPRTVRVQRIGFAAATSAVTVVAGETATADFTIREAPVSLEQIVVTATGDVRRKEVANSMATISAETIQDAPVAQHPAAARGADARRHGARKLRPAGRGRRHPAARQQQHLAVEQPDHLRRRRAHLQRRHADRAERRGRS